MHPVKTITNQIKHEPEVSGDFFLVEGERRPRSTGGLAAEKPRAGLDAVRQLRALRDTRQGGRHGAEDGGEGEEGRGGGQRTVTGGGTVRVQPGRHGSEGERLRAFCG